ncbi:MAG TPA: hydroxymethylbilane synthase [Phycisphaerae bacterium]|nr:hydroxymethylbilane synthase [Phycisphaerae bacterium]
MPALPPILRLATRGSLLARTQSAQVADLLRPHLPPGVRIELVTITTSGDRQADRPLQDAGGKGLFVKELDEALLAGAADFAVHSAKDLPVERSPDLLIAATPAREDPRDVWIGRGGLAIDALPPGALVGTVSLRRQAQLLARRPDLRVAPLRGNIDTRLRKVAEGVGGIAGTFLAAAGLRRSGLWPPDAAALPTDEFVPAAGQGTLAIEARRSDAALLEVLDKVHDPLTANCLMFERRLVGALAGNCLAPIGVVAQPRGIVDGRRQPGYLVRALVASPDGRQMARATLMAQEDDPAALDALGPLLLRTLEARGAREILAQSVTRPDDRTGGSPE